mmetsp:Transcript_14970/g.31672  ORF Transcript_14970/g.31672 Transcript_14970/m.31672 type:complete len:1013 (-) Transcript_14970:337-3375(-)
MDLFMDDMEVIPALPPINDDDCKEGEDLASATEKIKSSGDAITSKSIKEQPIKNYQLASSPTLSRGETMPRDADELSAIEDSIQRSYEIMNESNNILKDKDVSDFFNGSPSSTGGEKATPSGNASDKCGANDDDFTEEHLDLSVKDADATDYNANNEANYSKTEVGDSATNAKPENNIRSDNTNSRKSANGNAMQFSDDDSMDSNAEAPWMNSNPEVSVMFRYYAVRVGYARASFFREGEDGLERQHETRYLNNAAPMVKIRSAIFLYWDDARQFVENVENLDQDFSLEFKVEYDGFDSIAEAEAYLLEPETDLAWGHAASSGMAYPEVIDRNATSYYNNFHEQNPLPQFYVPHSLPLAPFASEINIKSTVPEDNPPELFHGVPDDREMNLALSSIETRSRAKLKRTSITASKPIRGRPKAGTRKPNLRPQPKNLTSKEKKERKEANIIPAAISHYYGFRDQYPVPRFFFPHTSLLAPAANELDKHSITFGKNSVELSNFLSLPSQGVSHDNALNSASASVKTRSKTESTRTSAPETPLRMKKSNPTRGRPKAVRRKPIQRPKPKKLTAKEMKEQKRSSMEEKWNKMFEMLLEYKEKNNGSLDIPAEDEEEEGDDNSRGLTKLNILEEKERRRLRRWCMLQKRQYRQWVRGENASEFFTEEKYSKLKDAGFEFATLTWDEQYEKLKEYKDAHGTLKIEKEHDEDLFKWSMKQRRILAKHFEGKAVRLTKERIDKLIDLGWQKTADNQRGIHDPADEEKKWDEKYQKLLQYIEKNGHMMFPNSNISHEDTYLRTWVAMIRQEYQKLQNGKESNLTAVKIKKLADIGFDFNPRGIPGSRTREARWEANFQALKDYKARHGDFTQCKNDDRKVLRIISKMREQYKRKQRGERCGLTDERIAQLEEIGFDFQRVKSPKVSDRRSWEERFQQLLEYKEKHGHCMVPRRTGGVLGQWVLRQRVYYKLLLAGEPSSLTHEKALRLSSIGFCFDASSRFRGTKRDNTNYTRPIFSQRKDG